MGNPVNHFEISGKDAARLQKFYAELFGWKINADNPLNYGIVEAVDGGIGGGISGGDPANPRAQVTFYVQVADPAATLKRAESMGGKTVLPPSDIPGGPQIAQFSDPDGNVIGLTKAG